MGLPAPRSLGPGHWAFSAHTCFQLFLGPLPPGLWQVQSEPEWTGIIPPFLLVLGLSFRFGEPLPVERVPEALAV